MGSSAADIGGELHVIERRRQAGHPRSGPGAEGQPELDLQAWNLYEFVGILGIPKEL